MSESPEFVKALNESCEKQYRGHTFGGEYVKAYSKDTIADKMEEIQRHRREIEAEVAEARVHADRVRGEMLIMDDPHLREITEALMARHRTDGELVCPNCGETNHGNKMNKKPWCMKCSLPLMTAEKAKNWEPTKKKPKFNEPWELDDDEIVKVRGEKKRHK